MLYIYYIKYIFYKQYIYIILNYVYIYIKCRLFHILYIFEIIFDIRYFTYI